jgi:hypothetical protein
MLEYTTNRIIKHTMKNITILYILGALVVGSVATTAVMRSPVGNGVQTQDRDRVSLSDGDQYRGYGNMMGRDMMAEEVTRGNCLADDCLALEGFDYPAGELSSEVIDALGKAIQDEYHARDFYNAVMTTFGSVRPFSMIVRAEEMHISSLEAIYDKYGLDIPADANETTAAPATLQEACQIGVDAEIANADLYKNELIPAAEGYEDIIGVFTNLMNASQYKHLPAFERCN